MVARKSGQNPFAVTTIPHYLQRGNLLVSSELVVKHKGYKLQGALKHLISYFYFEDENCFNDPEKKLAFNLMASNYIYFFELGMISDDNHLDYFIEFIASVNKSKKLEGPSKIMIDNSLEKLNLKFVNEYEYFGATKNAEPLTLVLNYQDRKVKKHPARYVGVGYNDKGNARISSKNGNPSWQDIAARRDESIKLEIETNTLLYRQKEIVNLTDIFFATRLETKCHWNNEVLCFTRIQVDGREGWKLTSCSYYQDYFGEKLHYYLMKLKEIRINSWVFKDESDNCWCFLPKRIINKH